MVISAAFVSEMISSLGLSPHSESQPNTFWFHPSFIPVLSHLSSCWWAGSSSASASPHAMRGAGACWEGRTLPAIQRGVLAPTFGLIHPPPWPHDEPGLLRALRPPTWISRNQQICNLPAVMNRGRLHAWLPPQAQMDDSGMLQGFLRRHR